MLRRLISLWEREKDTTIEHIDAAISRAERDLFVAEERSWIDRIEILRSRLETDENDLDPWARPWLDRSEELRKRISSDGGSKHLASMTVAQACMASKSAGACRLLLALVRQVRPETVLEMGTNIGISGLYLAAGLELNGKGRLITLEGSQSKSDLAARNFDELQLAHRVGSVTGDFADTLEPTVKRIPSVDLAFVDGFHDGTATVAYHRILRRYASSNAILIYDDIEWSPGMRTAWRSIRKDKQVRSTTCTGAMGICWMPTLPFASSVQQS